MTIPATIAEPIKSAAFSAALALQSAALTLIGAAAAEGHVSSPGDLGNFMFTHWWGAALGIILPAAYRAREKSVALSNTISLGGGQTAVVSQSKGPTP